MEKKKFNAIGIITAMTFAIMVLLNVLANALPINGKNTGEISDFYANLFAPAGYTFIIWGLIYLMLALYTFYQLGFFSKNDLGDRDELFKYIGILFSLSSVANSIWILAWHYDKILLSTILIILILISIILVNLKIYKERLSLKEKLLIYAPFSIYFGWLTVATIANITTLLVSVGWDGLGISESIWTLIILIIGFIISSIVILKEKNVIYGLVIVWSYVGIYMKHISVNGWDSKYPLVIAGVTICIGLLIVVILYTLFMQLKKKKISEI